MGTPVPLPVLLSHALARRTAQLEADAGGSIASLAVWSNVLRCLADEPALEPELARRGRLSTRLAVAAVTGCARRGWLTADKDGRRRTAALTAAGRSSHQAWTASLAEPGSGDAVLRPALTELVGRLPYELAHHPATYGTADPSVIGGPFVRGSGEDGLPAHGQDWRWVVRPSDGGDLALPVTALLSQALSAYAIDYEAHPMWPLASTTLVVQHLSLTPRPLADLAPGHGITGKGTSLLERHGLAVITPDPASPKRALVALTPYGEQVRQHHVPYLAAVEAAWRERFGADVVDALRAALEAAVEGSDEALPDHVVAPLHLG